MTAAKHLTCACLWLIAGLAHAQPLIPPTAIDWLLDCPLPTVERLDPEVLQRTQCGIVTVPRNYASPRQGNLRLYLTRVGARDPLNREGVLFALAGDAPRSNQGGTFVIHLTSLWGTYANPAYRTLINRYDVIELSPRDLSNENGVEQAAQDLEYVRTQLGDAQLLYLGNADAARLGNRYAALFPERVARMVLVNAQQAETAAPQVEQLRLKDPAKQDASGCINRWVGDFLVYGKQPPQSTRCLDSVNAQ
ncbi:alpha/beta hydrolase [Pseudomonas sp. MAFF 311095]|uniref:Alpha/beta hydrolase n=1 Tax=Pseudomonas petroselini TaxID=2899822 RepID=A0ABS8R1L5_9PSED|nr:alpha/beta fold hydrolase [Pseudomonas petroselini]MCD7040592.1 alpha/beta hydrolase [Pseudomonas petroselini]MCD7045165.1 alpha/beta hydrolase [Pseudomonas petroselini]MCD7071311.1 alpha/beta hydrolase [Pseudomonas petroselini]MCD7079350.1 alpha/beta hydrolase [Pseudomonas petroselini]